MESSHHHQQIILAAGCFWGVQFYLDQIPGVIETTAGYSGGHTPNPSYEDVCYRDTGHAEVVRVRYDPAVLTIETLLQHFFRLHDPTQRNRQGPDVGSQYRSAIFYSTDQQRECAEAIIASLNDVHVYSAPIATEIHASGAFYPAEEYHQKYTEKTGRGMCHTAYRPQ